jgi:hypothetical protein
MSTEPTPSTVKKLFSLSGNTCALPQCEAILFDRNWEGIRARICHIAGEHRGAARFHEMMTEDERRAFENLIVLCPSCHALIDELEPKRYTIELLKEIKDRHESRAESPEKWCTEAELTAYVTIALVGQFGVSPVQEVESIVPLEGSASGDFTFTANATGLIVAAPDQDVEKALLDYMNEHSEQARSGMTSTMMATITGYSEDLIEETARRLRRGGRLPWRLVFREP